MYHKRRHMTPTFKFSGDLRKEKREKRQSCRVEVRIELFLCIYFKRWKLWDDLQIWRGRLSEDTRVYLRVNGGERGHRIDIITLIWKVPSSATSSSIRCGLRRLHTFAWKTNIYWICFFFSLYKFETTRWTYFDVDLTRRLINCRRFPFDKSAVVDGCLRGESHLEISIGTVLIGTDGFIRYRRWWWCGWLV